MAREWLDAAHRPSYPRREREQPTHRCRHALAPGSARPPLSPSGGDGHAHQAPGPRSWHEVLSGRAQDQVQRTLESSAGRTRSAGSFSPIPRSLAFGPGRARGDARLDLLPISLAVMGFQPSRGGVQGLAQGLPSLVSIQVWSYSFFLWLCIPAGPAVGDGVLEVPPALVFELVEQKKESMRPVV